MNEKDKDIPAVSDLEKSTLIEFPKPQEKENIRQEDPGIENMIKIIQEDVSLTTETLSLDEIIDEVENVLKNPEYTQENLKTLLTHLLQLTPVELHELSKKLDELFRLNPSLVNFELFELIGKAYGSQLKKFLLDNDDILSMSEFNLTDIAEIYFPRDIKANDHDLNEGANKLVNFPTELRGKLWARLDIDLLLMLYTNSGRDLKALPKTGSAEGSKIESYRAALMDNIATFLSIFTHLIQKYPDCDNVSCMLIAPNDLYKIAKNKDKLVPRKSTTPEIQRIIDVIGEDGQIEAIQEALQLRRDKFEKGLDKGECMSDTKHHLILFESRDEETNKVIYDVMQISFARIAGEASMSIDLTPFFEIH